MTTRGSSGYYRRGAYRKRKWRNIIIVVAVLLAVSFALFLIIGNILKNKTDDEGNGGGNTFASEPIDTTVSSISINGYGIDLTDISLSEFSEQLSGLVGNGTTAISLNLTDSDGNLIYNSSTAQSLGYQSASNSLISLSGIVSRAESRGVYTSSYITISSLGEKDAKIRSARLAYEAAIVCEIAEAGIDDVIIRCPDMSVEHTDELVRFAENIKNINNNANVGISITKELLDSADSALYIEKLVAAFDFTAFDVTNNKDIDISEYVESTLSDSNVRYYILRYNTRILLPIETDEAAKNSFYSSLNANSINNWQTVKK